jgi:hypothetical protein
MPERVRASPRFFRQFVCPLFLTFRQFVCPLFLTFRQFVCPLFLTFRQFVCPLFLTRTDRDSATWARDLRSNQYGCSDRRRR